MKPEPLVSVIMPLYNAEKYVSDAIKSIINQTYTNWELLIVNDGSTDKSHKLAKTFESDKIKVFSQENKGASAARNYGLREAKGEYIQFLDADDLLSANKIEEQVKLLVENPGKLAVCPTVYFFDEETHLQKIVEHNWIKEGSDDPIDFLIKLYGGALIGLEYGGMVQPNAWLTPRMIIDKAGFWNEDLSLDDDGEFFCRVVLASRGIIYAANAGNYYRKFKINKSLSTQKSRKAMESIFMSTELKEKYLLLRTNDVIAKTVIGRLYSELALITYPSYKLISKKAENRAKELGFDNFLRFHNLNFKGILYHAFGWKFINLLIYYKIKFLK